MTKISVCMATHNGEKYIQDQIDSILLQLKDDDELIISDDGSEDTTISIIHAYRDKRIKLLESKSMNNPIKNFENALVNSSGDIIFLSDQDDVWMPDKVKIMMHALEKNHLVLSDCFVVDDKLQPLNPSLFQLNKTGLGFWRNIWKNGYTGCCMAFTRKMLNDALPFPKDIPMHDQWIGLVAELRFEPIRIKDKLTLYRRHSKNTTMTGYRSNYSIVSKIRFRFNMVKNLMRLYV